MVWGLFPIDPLPGEDSYYIFAKGTYNVGRKGCDIIINKDKGVSRKHAEIIVDDMIFLYPLHNKSSSAPSAVRVRDCSKYGTFINKDLGSKENIHELPNKVTTIKDGDLISFGTGNATYRFCFVPLTIFLYWPEPIQADHSLQDKVSLIGARIAHEFSTECTHVLVNQFMPVKEELLDAIVAKKPFALCSWLEHVAEKGIQTDIPSCSSYTPTLTLEGVNVRVADSEARKNCLEGYKFLMESTDLYKYGHRLQLLLEVSGAMILLVEEFCSTIQATEDGDNTRVVCVIPGGSLDKADHLHKLSSLSRVKEMDLVRAIVAGHLDRSIFVSPSVVISSSCSTDETVVADSEEEAETAASSHATTVVGREGTTKHESKVNTTSDHAATRLENIHSMNFQNKSLGRIDKIDDSESDNVEVIYSQDLIVRNFNLTASISSRMKSGVPNFKRFRKVDTQSGNSFNSLIPFSKYPYTDSDYGNEEIVESVKEEKKRKQMEAIADDLFNNEKGRRRGMAGSLQGLITRG